MNIKEIIFLASRDSHRTLGEQILGFAIFICISLGFYILSLPPLENFLIVNLSSNLSWHVTVWLFNRFVWVIYFCLISYAIWSLWRYLPLKELKFELTFFLLQFVFLGVWRVSLFSTKTELLSLFCAIFLLIANTALALLVWKKRKISGQLLFFNVLWTLYMVAVTMTFCILNP